MSTPWAHTQWWQLAALIIALQLGVCVSGHGGLQAAQAENEIMTGDEMDDRFRQRRRESAASFRVQMREIAGTLGEEYQQNAADIHAQAQRHFINGRYQDAIALARSGYRNYPFADHAPDLAHLLMRLYAATGSPGSARGWLVDLWERYPSYDGIERAMHEALISARALRAEGMTIDHRALSPEDVVQVHNLPKVLAANNLFRFLARHGDRQDVAPEARLGLAQALLAEGGKDRINDARIAYDDFLISHPQHPLVFEALIELAVSYVITYRGPRFDVGVLIDAAHIIDQAELYTREIPERVEIVRHYRALIRGWHQERDLYVAKWYRDHRRWDASRYYYQAVVRRDPTSEAGREAERALAELPETDDEAPPMRLIDWLRI